MKIIAHIDISAHTILALDNLYNMDLIDIKAALEAYNKRIFSIWDEGAISFFDFLEEDVVGNKEFTHV